MDRATIIAQVQKDLQDVPKAIGVNNHMGSRFTNDHQGMLAALTAIKGQSLFFVDSMTSSQSIAYETAQELGIKTARRDIFLDNEQNGAKIKAQLDKLVKRAKQNGSAIGIGHPYPATLATLKKELVAGEAFYSRRQAHREIGDYIERFYNCWRRHSSLGHLSPAAFEQQVARSRRSEVSVGLAC